MSAKRAADSPSTALRRASLIVLIALCSVQTASAEPYQSGHQALQVWDAAAQANLPTPIKAWLITMAISMLAGLVFVWRRVEARWVVGGFLLGLITTRLLIPQLEIVKLSGLVSLVHLLFWSPGLVLLGIRQPFRDEKSLYAAWSALVTLVILISFYFDIPDAIVYLRHVLAS